jgi:hypothetical protein
MFPLRKETLISPASPASEAQPEPMQTNYSYAQAVRTSPLQNATK